jgi:hypothetical protein
MQVTEVENATAPLCTVQFIDPLLVLHPNYPFGNVCGSGRYRHLLSVNHGRRRTNNSGDECK